MADIKYYDVILRPVITEKSMNMMGEKKYAFYVHPDAPKIQRWRRCSPAPRLLRSTP